MKKNKHIESQKRLEHIVKAIEEIETFIKNETLETFCQNNKLNNAVLFCLTVMGEAIAGV